jgi:hypothetical protein
MADWRSQKETIVCQMGIAPLLASSWPLDMEDDKGNE